MPAPTANPDDSLAAFMLEDVENELEVRHSRSEESVQAARESEAANPPRQPRRVKRTSKSSRRSTDSSKTASANAPATQNPSDDANQPDPQPKNTNPAASDALKRLPEADRQRVLSWCKITDGESVLGFLPDAEIGRDRRGEAGLVVTNQALHYHKYHRHGRTDLNAPDAHLIALPVKNGLTRLMLVTANDRHRLGTFKPKYVERLEKLLGKVCSMRIEQTDKSSA